MRRKVERIDPNNVPRSLYPSRLDAQKAKRMHGRRPEKAQQVDNGMFSHPTKYYHVWETDPSRWDMWGVDTPKKGKKGKEESEFW